VWRKMRAFREKLFQITTIHDAAPNSVRKVLYAR